MPHLPGIAGHVIIFSSIAAKREFAGAMLCFTCDTLFCAIGERRLFGMSEQQH
jgi:hypothetical protein